MSGLFPLGRVVATPAALTLMMENPEDAIGLLDRHQSGDWGEVCAEDARENERSLKYGFRILSVYRVGGERLYVLTEADRSATTILKPSEY